MKSGSSKREYSIAAESPDTQEIRDLIAELNAQLLARYRPEECHHLTIDQLTQPDIAFFVARHDGSAVGCGALRRIREGSVSVGEVKRMYTVNSYRRHGVGRQILRAIEAQARAEKLQALLLETGIRQPEANALYRSEGFAVRGPYLDYPDNGVSVFMEKHLDF
jgi:putative acetyltransferase